LPNNEKRDGATGVSTPSVSARCGAHEGASSRLLERLLDEEQQRLTVRKLELDGQAAAIEQYIEALKRKRAALEAQIGEKGA